MTISAVTLAILEARDGSAFAAARELGGIFYPVINFFLQFWENGANERAREAARSRKLDPFANDNERGNPQEHGESAARRAV